MYDSREALAASVEAAVLDDLPVFLHVLTHKDLYLHPVQTQWPPQGQPGPDGAWVEAPRCVEMGLPAPIRKLLSAI